MTSACDRLVPDLLGPLHMHFRVAREAYRNYLDQGRSFQFASSLRRTNASARTLLLDHGWMLPDALQDDAAALIGHYDVWLTLWDDHAAGARFAPTDPFVFENSFTYPKESELRLERLYEELTGAA